MNGVAGVANKNSLEISLTEFGLILLLLRRFPNFAPLILLQSSSEILNLNDTVKDEWNEPTHIVWKIIKMSHLNFGIFRQFLSYQN